MNSKRHDLKISPRPLVSAPDHPSARFEQWQQANPDRPFSAFYAQDVEAQLGAGLSHATLGGKLKWDDSFESAGREIFEKLRSEAVASKPSFVFSNAVLMHVHPDELHDYARNLMTLASLGGQAWFSVKCSERTVQYSDRSWCHARQVVEAVFAAQGAELEEVWSDPTQVPGAPDARRYWLRARRVDR